MSNGDHQVLLNGAAAGIDESRAKHVASSRVIESGKIRWGWGGVARIIAGNLGRWGSVQMINAVGDDRRGKEYWTCFTAWV
jgi:hypothetical protein